MRHSELATKKTSSSRYAARTRVDVHRSRFEVERVLGRYGATDFAFVEDHAAASIQFAIHGRYVQVALPLPDAESASFTHTPSGKPRSIAARERAYEQALRENWRAFVLVLRGKLESVESGISSFEDEFANFLLPAVADEDEKKSPKAIRWLLRSSHSLAFVLVAAALLPASAVTAFALPPSVVENISAPFRQAPDVLGLASLEALPAASQGAAAGKAGPSGRADTQALASHRGGSTSSSSRHTRPGRPGKSSSASSGAQTPAPGKSGGEGASPSAGPAAGGGQTGSGRQTGGGGQSGSGDSGSGHTDNGNHYGQAQDNGNHYGADNGKKSGQDAAAGANSAGGKPGNGSGGGKKGASAPSSGP
jgi:hypothetical protein